MKQYKEYDVIKYICKLNLSSMLVNGTYSKLVYPKCLIARNISKIYIIISYICCELYFL